MYEINVLYGFILYGKNLYEGSVGAALCLLGTLKSHEVRSGIANMPTVSKDIIKSAVSLDK